MPTDAMPVEEPTGSSTGQIELRYDGPAFEERGMEISELAPALLGFSDACKRAHVILNRGKESEVSVRLVQSGEGSLIALIIVVVTHAIHAGTPMVQHVVSVVNPIAGVCNIVKFIRDSRGGKPENLPLTLDPHNRRKVRITRPNGEIVEVEMTPGEQALFLDKMMRQGVDKFIDPAREKGIDKMVLVPENGEEVVVTKDEANEIKPPAS